MAIELIRTQPLKGYAAVILILLAVCSVSGESAMAVYLHDTCNSSFSHCLTVSGWSLEPEHGRRLLQTSNYLTYKGLDKDRAAGQPSKPGNSYNRGCQSYYQCRS